MHHPGFSCPLCRTFANLEEDVEVEPVTEVSSDPDIEPLASQQTPRIPGGNAGTVVGHGEAMDVDFMAGGTASAHMNAGAETEVEHDGNRSFRRGVQRTVVPEQDDEDDLGEEEGDLGEHSGESGSGSGSGALHGDEEDLEDWHIPRDIEDAAGALPSTSAADNPGLVLGEPITGILNRARLGIEGPRRGYEVGRGYLPEGMTPEMHRELEALGDHSPMAAASPSSVQGVSVVDVRSRDEESDPDGDEADSARERAIGAKRKR